LAQADHLLVAGQAGSHCVRASVEHLAEWISPSRLVLLEDCMSPVTGFAAAQAAFLEGMAARGARVVSSTVLAAELQPRVTAGPAGQGPS
jgi:nicotinamidase-related amidase